MKESLWVLFALIAAITWLHAKQPSQKGILKGRIYPAAAIIEVLAIKGSDTIRALPKDGAFDFRLSTGRYMVVVKAQKPYNDFSWTELQVGPGKTEDLGELNIER